MRVAVGVLVRCVVDDAVELTALGVQAVVHAEQQLLELRSMVTM